MLGDAVVIGSRSAFATPIADRLAEDGYRVVGLGGENAEPRPGVTLRKAGSADLDDVGRFLEAELPGFAPSGIVIAPELPASARIDDVSAHDFVLELDEVLAKAGRAAKSLVVNGRSNQPPRIVLVSDFTAFWRPEQSTAAAVMGGLLGLSRSWALEFAPLGVTANAVVVGPDATAEYGAQPGRLASLPSAADVAHAVAFFLDPRSAAITGQVLAVCGGRSTGTLPL